MIAPNWTAKLEYLYVDLGSGQIFNIVPGVPESVGFTANTVRLGINYRFGDPATAPRPLYSKAPYAKAPVTAGNPWSGWYGGVNAGYVDGSSTMNTDAVVISNSTTPATAYGGVKSSTTIGQTAPGSIPLVAMGTAGSFSDNRVGYTVGAGGEWMFMSKWSAKAEYLYYDLGSANYGTGGMAFNETPTNFPGFGFAAVATSTRVHFNGNIVRFGLNYHLN